MLVIIYFMMFLTPTFLQINGGTADLDGKLAKGDLLISVNGQSVENASGDEAGAILKTVTGRISLKLNRYKPSTR